MLLVDHSRFEACESATLCGAQLGVWLVNEGAATGAIQTRPVNLCLPLEQIHALG